MNKRIVAISDVHCKWNQLKIPECDILISAGDYSFHGEPSIVKSFHGWLDEQPANDIISVQGNHELGIEANFNHSKEIALKACPGVHFIEEGLVEIDGIKIWCSAMTPWFHNWAYNRHRGPDIKKHWDLIPNGIDILVTHGAPYGILDTTVYADGTPKEKAGCNDLLDAVKRVKPQIHIFGHIHSGYGEHHEGGTSFYNAAICDEQYCATNPITIIDFIK